MDDWSDYDDSDEEKEDAGVDEKDGKEDEKILYKQVRRNWVNCEKVKEEEKQISFSKNSYLNEHYELLWSWISWKTLNSVQLRW